MHGAHLLHLPRSKALDARKRVWNCLATYIKPFTKKKSKEVKFVKIIKCYQNLFET